jgi:hypothetical protein
MNSSLVNLSHFRTLGPINDIIKLAIGTAITAGGLEIIAIGAAIYVTAPSIIAIGVGLVGLSAIYGASVLTRPGLVLIGNTILDAIQNAISIQNSNVSSEYEESENPFTALAELENNNANFNKKICYVSYDIYSHPYTVNDDFLPTATQFEWGIRVEYTDASLSDCDDTYSYTTVVRKGYYFEIGPVHDFSITTISAENCPGSTALYKTFHFKY